MEVIEIELEAASGNPVSLSYRMDLIMLHSDNMSAQWSPEHVGVEVCSFGREDVVKLAFHSTGGHSGQNYQSFYFKKAHKEDLILFFKKLGFPCPQPMQAGNK
jgi:hypothetical protein